jgi:hypothetical protein
MHHPHLDETFANGLPCAFLSMEDIAYFPDSHNGKAHNRGGCATAS